MAIKAGREAWDDGFSEPLRHRVHRCLGSGWRPIRTGRFDILAIGESRYRLQDVDTSSDLLKGSAHTLPDVATEQSPVLAGKVGRLFSRYLVALRSAGGIRSEDDNEDLPPNPTDLSFFVADGMILDLTDKQALLAATDTDDRLTLELALLRREAAMVAQFSMRPAVELPRAPYSTN